jgi:hypothetical protein
MIPGTTAAAMPSPNDFTELDQFEIDPRSVRLLPEDFCRERQVVVLGVVSGGDPEAEVPVGMVEPRRLSLLKEVKSRLGRPVRPVQLNAFEVRRALDRGFGLGDPALDPAVLHLSAVGEVAFRDGAAPLLVDEILGRAVELGASDVHSVSYGHDVDLRSRVDGVLRQVPTALSVDNIDSVIARLKVLADLDANISSRSRCRVLGVFLLAYVEGSFYCLIQFLDLASVAPTH